MTNEEFQKTILHELKAINTRIGGIDNKIEAIDNRIEGLDNRIEALDTRIGGIDNKIEGLENRIVSLEINFSELKEGQKRIEARQDEIYLVVRAIEHSNQVGRSELDSQNIRISKLEGKFKRVAKAYNEDIDIEKASNL